MRISDWSSDVCSSDLHAHLAVAGIDREWVRGVVPDLKERFAARQRRAPPPVCESHVERGAAAQDDGAAVGQRDRTSGVERKSGCVREYLGGWLSIQTNKVRKQSSTGNSRT